MDWSLLQQAHCSECGAPVDRHSPTCAIYQRQCAGMQNAVNQIGNLSYNAYMNAQSGMFIAIDPPPRKLSWLDVLAEGLENDLRAFWKWIIKRRERP